MGKFLQIREELIGIVLLVLALWTISLALSHQLFPSVILLICCTHFFLLGITNFNETSPPPLLHFYRSIEGVVVIALPLGTFFYFMTYFIEGRSDLAMEQAEISLLFVFFLAIWVLLAGLTVFGFYFAVRIFWYWADFLGLYMYGNYPFIVYPGVLILGLMAVATWFTHLRFLYGALNGQENMGKGNETYREYAKPTIIISILTGTALLVWETVILTLLLSIF